MTILYGYRIRSDQCVTWLKRSDREFTRADKTPFLDTSVKCDVHNRKWDVMFEFKSDEKEVDKGKFV